MRRRYSVMALLCVLGAILYIDRICISLALPAIQKELAIEPELLGWISVAFSVGYALFEIPTGHLGDRYGTRSTLMRITVAWSIFTALTGAMFGFTSLLIVRFLFGVGEAGAWPNVSTVVTKWFPATSRARAMGLFGAATAIGGGLAPFIVIPIQHAYGWRASFFLFGGCGIVWAIVWYSWYRDSPAELGASPEEIAELGPVPPRATHGLRWRIALRKPSIWALMGAAFANIYTAFFAVFWMPSFLKAGRGFDDGELKWTAAIWIASMAGNAVGGFISDFAVKRLGRGAGRRSVAIGSMLGVAAIFLAIVSTDDKVVTIMLLASTGFIWGLIQANMFATCIDIGGLHTGTVAGTMNTAGQLGGALSAVAFGYLLRVSGGYDLPLLVMAGAMLVGAICWIAIDASKPLVPPDRA